MIVIAFVPSQFVSLSRSYRCVTGVSVLTVCTAVIQVCQS